jgi:isopenicillin N synthase-like dioxygenase
MADIPVIDFAKAVNGTAEEKQQVAKQIDEAFRGAGFVYLLNHGVPLDMVADCFTWVRGITNIRACMSKKLTWP